MEDQDADWWTCSTRTGTRPDQGAAGGLRLPGQAPPSGAPSGPDRPDRLSSPAWLGLAPPRGTNGRAKTISLTLFHQNVVDLRCFFEDIAGWAGHPRPPRAAGLRLHLTAAGPDAMRAAARRGPHADDRRRRGDDWDGHRRRRCEMVAVPHGRRQHLVRDVPFAGRAVLLVWSKRMAAPTSHRRPHHVFEPAMRVNPCIRQPTPAPHPSALILDPPCPRPLPGRTAPAARLPAALRA
jgi:hypothetical protein